MVPVIILLAVLIAGFVGYLIIDRNKELAFCDFRKVDVPYVIIEVQGKKLNMIVDTACGISILHKKSAEEAGLRYTHKNSKTNITSLTAETVAMRNIEVPVEINGKEVGFEFSLFESDENFSDFKKYFGITMHGLLGSDFLDKYNCVINYKKHTLRIRQ